MNRSLSQVWLIALFNIMLWTGVCVAQPPPPAGETLPANPIEVQTRGPVHEAFAQPLDPKPGTPIPKAPPAPINEQPPELRRDAENAQWIPGYWAWEPERQEFLWVSGTYRTPPQGRNFVPGYWANTPEGWRWVAGFWSDATQPQIPYAPEPPAPLNTEPSTPAPDADSLYLPGNWVYRDTRFLWRPGYWTAAQTGQVWVPPHFSWTPAGYAFLDGYWDYPLEDRGLLFAPVRFNQPLAAGFAYTPDYVVNYDGFLDSGYYLSGFGQFYFGNYSDPRYARYGYRPWYTGAGRYNPAFAQHTWRNSRGNPNWLAGVQRTYTGRTSGQLAGPPLTLAQQHAGNAVVVSLRQFKNNQAGLVQQPPRQTSATSSNTSAQILVFPSAANTRSPGSNSGTQVVTNFPRGNAAPMTINPAASAQRVYSPPAGNYLKAPVAPTRAATSAPVVRQNTTTHVNTARVYTPPQSPRLTAPVRTVNTANAAPKTGGSTARPAHHK